MIAIPELLESLAAAIHTSATGNRAGGPAPLPPFSSPEPVVTMKDYFPAGRNPSSSPFSCLPDIPASNPADLDSDFSRQWPHGYFHCMKQFSAIVVLATILGTMYGYVLGRLPSRPPQTPPVDPWLAPKTPTFLLQGNFWDQFVFWSALPLFALFAWLTINYVGNKWLRDKQTVLNEKTLAQVEVLFQEVSAAKNRAPETGV